MQNCVEFFEQEGASREVAGNHPLCLDDPRSVWLVGSGRVDVFAVPFASGRSAGARIHLATIEAGQLLFGSRCDSPDQPRLVAVGIPGSQVFQLEQRRLQQLAADPARAAQIAVLVDRWIESLTSGVTRGRLPRRISVLEAEKDVRFEANSFVSPAQGTLWLCDTEGTFELLDKGALSLDPSDDVFPLPGSGWLTTQAGASLKAVKTESLLGDSRLWTGLRRFQRMISSCAVAGAQEATAVERGRLHQKSRSEKQLTQAALAQLAAAVKPEGAVESLVATERDPLVAACRLVGERMGISIHPPLNYAEKTWSDPVGAIARGSAVRTRRVLLSDQWWRQDNGALLGFRTEDDRPVALLPTSTSSYELVDPAARSRTPVTRENAAHVQAFGYCFYRSFPSRALTPRDVLQFGLLGTWRDWLVVVLLGVVGALLGLLVPIAMGLIIEWIIPAAERYQLLLLVMALTTSAVVIGLFSFTQGVAVIRVEAKMDCAVEAGVWDRLLNLPASFFRKHTAGDLAMRAMGIGHIRQVMTEAAMSSILTFFFSLMAFGLLFYYDVRLAILASVLFLTTVAVTCIGAYIQLPYERRSYHVRGRVTGIVLQLLTGISRLRVAGAEDRALAFWARNFSLQTKLSFQAQCVANNLATFMAAVPVLASLFIFASVALFPLPGLTLAGFLAFNVAFVQIVTASVMMSSTITSVLDIVPLYERARPILETLPEFHRAKRDPGELNGEIEISHVSFRYLSEGPLVLDDVSVHVRPGEFVAFVGPSGAGKSTILRLLLAFEAPSSGSLYYDREDLSGLDHQAVRRQIGVVLQNSRLTPGDVFHNIIGSSPLTMDDAWEAARLSGLDDDIKQMPMGMYTFISEGESTLSGGQRQRLMIARAIVTKPKILLFDEATSALDNVTQAKVARSLEGLKTTRVVVAHRLSTVVNADRIYVIDRGKVVQQGHYDDLIEQPGLFADLAKRQLL